MSTCSLRVDQRELAIEEDFGVGSFVEGVGCDGANGDVADAQFIERFLEATHDLDRLFDGGRLDLSVAEDVTPEGDILFEEVDAFPAAIL